MTEAPPDGPRFRLNLLPRPKGAYTGDDGTVFDPTLGFLHPVVADGLAYWESKRRGRRFPARADIDPLEIPRLLPHVLLMERVPTRAAPGYGWRYRLVGTGVATLYGEHTGKLMEDALKPHVARRNRGVIEEAVSRAAPMRAIGRTRFMGHEWLLGEALVAPLSADGETIDMILSVVVTWAEQQPPAPVRDAWLAAIGVPA